MSPNTIPSLQSEGEGEEGLHREQMWASQQGPDSGAQTFSWRLTSSPWEGPLSQNTTGELFSETWHHMLWLETTLMCFFKAMWLAE